MRNSIENRRHRRWPVPIITTVRYRQPALARSIATLDLSEEGAQFRDCVPVVPGMPLLVFLQDEIAGVPLECKGRIIWCVPSVRGSYRYGVRFLDLSDEERDRIRDLAALPLQPIVAAV